MEQKFSVRTQATVTRILGLDPGLRVTGFGIIDVLGSQMRYVASGCIRTSGNGLPERLKILLLSMQEICANYRPDEAAAEIVFVNVNPKSTLLLGQARGAVICGAVSADLPVSEYTALQIKQAVVGYGKASKDQVAHMVQRLLVLPELPASDAADALACAICHAQSRGVISQLAGSGSQRKRGRMRLKFGLLYLSLSVGEITPIFIAMLTIKWSLKQLFLVLLKTIKIFSEGGRCKMGLTLINKTYD